MNSRKEHPQKVQSRQWLQDSLLRLMRKQDYYTITIKQLAKEADLDRKTFYRHFKNKEEVIFSILDVLLQEYMQELKDETTLSSFVIAEKYFIVCIKTKSLLNCYINIV